MSKIRLRDFPSREELIVRIKWLLNEMEYAHKSIEDGELDEAKETLRKEFEDNFWFDFKLKNNKERTDG